ncbi:MAG: hypothetical protein ABI813_09240 [Bacteroidota bacterium]
MQKINLISMKNKYHGLFICLAFFCVSCTAGADGGYVYRQPVYIAPGVGLGTIIAVVLSWTRNKSVLWAIIHGILGWLYVIYALIFPKK